MREQVEMYLAGSGKGHEALTTCAEILDAWCISKPTEGDIEKLKAELLVRGKKPQTVANWLTMFRKFLDWNCPNWRQPQEGEIEQMSLGFEDEQERAGLQNEPETPAVSENTSTGEGKDTGILEHEPVDVDVQDEPDTLSPTVEAEQQQTRRGRKPKPEKTDRVQLGTYVRGEIAEKLKKISEYTGLDVSSIIAGLISEFVERNEEAIKAREEAMRALKFSNPFQGLRGLIK